MLNTADEEQYDSLLQQVSPLSKTMGTLLHGECHVVMKDDEPQDEKGKTIITMYCKGGNEQ